jgi:hypothetical protein
MNVMEDTPTHGTGTDNFVSGPVAVLGHVEEYSVGGGGAVFVFGDVVVLAAPEEDDVVSVLLGFESEDELALTDDTNPVVTCSTERKRKSRTA